MCWNLELMNGFKGIKHEKRFFVNNQGFEGCSFLKRRIGSLQDQYTFSKHPHPVLMFNEKPFESLTQAKQFACYRAQNKKPKTGLFILCAIRDSNPWPSPRQGDALPTELTAQISLPSHYSK